MKKIIQWFKKIFFEVSLKQRIARILLVIISTGFSIIFFGWTFISIYNEHGLSGVLIIVGVFSVLATFFWAGAHC